MPGDTKKNNPVREGRENSSLRSERKDEQGRSYPFPDEGQMQHAHQPEFIDPDPEFMDSNPKDDEEKNREQPSGKE